MWFDGKLTIVAVCFCLSLGGVFGSTLRKREVSSKDADKSTEDKNDSSIWDDVLGKDDDDSWSNDSSNKTKDTGSSNDLIKDFDSDNDSKEGSRNSTKNTGSDRNSTKDSDSKKKSDKESKKKAPSTTKAKNSTSDTKNEKNDASTDGLNGSDTDDIFNWPNDQGWNGTSSRNATKASNVTSPSTNSTTGPNTTLENSKANSTTGQSNGTLDKPQNNSSPSIPTPSPATNFTSAENVTSQIPHQNVTSTKFPNATTPTPETTETNYSTGYWIPIFNFGNNFYLLTNKGYAQLVNFPAPIIYSFKPVSVRPAGAKPTRGQGQPREEEEEIVENFYDNGASFSECYIDINMGNLIPNSYFGSWVAVFKLEQGWHLQTYGGFVPLDLTGEEAPLTYVFEPVKYQYSTLEKYSTEANQSQGTDDGLANWSEPVVVEE